MYVCKCSFYSPFVGNATKIKKKMLTPDSASQGTAPTIKERRSHSFISENPKIKPIKKTLFV